MCSRKIHCIRPVDDLKPFASNSVDLVYASHCLEHFSHRKVNTVLTEWHRVLKPGGILRLGVPDFDRIIDIYTAKDRNIDAILPYLMGSQSYPLNFHYCAFNKASLTDRLKQVGFTTVREWHRDMDELTSLPDCTGMGVEIGDRRIPVSLNLEAVK